MQARLIYFACLFHDCINLSQNLFAARVISVYCEIWPSLQRAIFMSHFASGNNLIDWVLRNFLGGARSTMPLFLFPWWSEDIDLEGFL
jgi:hypothetical protein